MAENFHVISRDDRSTLHLEAHNRDYFIAELRGLNLQAQTLVSTYMSGGLADLFDEMAAQWRGWPGRKTWGSLEGELHLSAEADRTGHVTVTASLREGAPSGWSVELVLVLEAGQLEQLARQARGFEVSVLSAT